MKLNHILLFVSIGVFSSANAIEGAKIISTDPSGTTIIAGTLMPLRSYSLDGKSYVAITSQPVSLVGQKYLLPAGSIITGTCKGGNSGNIVKINDKKVKNVLSTKYNQAFYNKDLFNTTCTGLNGEPMIIATLEGLKLPKSADLIKIPGFNKVLDYSVKNKLFDISKIETNGYQMKITFEEEPKNLGLIGRLNSSGKGIVSFNEKFNPDAPNTVIVDGVYDTFIIAINDKEWETVTLKKD